MAVLLFCCPTALFQYCIVWLMFFCCSLTLYIILGYENCMWHVSVKGVFQFSLFDNRTRTQAYGALRILHHPAPGWNCVTATTNTNCNPETNPNIHPPSLASNLTYPRPPTCLLASDCCQQCGEVQNPLSAQAYRNRALWCIQLYRVAQKVG